MSIVWLFAEGGGLSGLDAALSANGTTLRRADGADLPAAALELYDGRGLLLVDARTTLGRAVLADTRAVAVPVVGIAPREVPLPDGVLRLLPAAPDRMAHHLLDILAEPSNLRRHPRVRMQLAVRIGGVVAETEDVSLYGLRVVPDGSWANATGRQEAEVYLDDGARIGLWVEVVDQRPDGVALRGRPRTDEDLLLWIHLILGGLEDSPLHGDIDPFGPLFD